MSMHVAGPSPAPMAPTSEVSSVAVAAVTDVGPTRERNEDAVLVPGVVLGGASRGRWAGMVDCGAGAVVQVIDGMGGHGAGSIASVLAATMMNEFTAARPVAAEPDSEWLAQRIQAVGDAVTDFGALDPRTKIMGAVAAGLIIGKRTVLVYNVGDCRVYVLEDGYLSLLTTDHRGRTGGLTRSLGGTGKRETVEADMIPMDRSAFRRYLLCSDGLTDTLEFDAIREAVQAGTVAQAATRLVTEAVAAESRDNVTVLVADVGAV